MLYVDISLPIPEGAKLAGSNNSYVYLKLGPSKRDNEHKLKHNFLLIGKKSTEDNFFHPNDNYYSNFNLEKPKNSTVVKRGRRPKIKSTVAYHELHDDVNLVFGYSIACYYIFKKLNLLNILEKIFGDKNAKYILAIASYFVFNETCSCSELDIFSQHHNLFTDKIITSQRASELFKEITPEDRGTFFRNWLEANTSPDHIFYDVTSISSYSSNISEVSWGYNRDNDHLPQINLGIFVSRLTRLPLFYCKYDGSINDFSNFQTVLSYARDLGIDENFTIVFDGIFSNKNTVKYCSYKNNKIIVGVPLSKNKNAKEKILNWRMSKSFKFLRGNDLFSEGIESTEEEFEIGGVKGRLVLFYSVNRKSLEAPLLIEEANNVQKFIEDNNYVFTERQSSKINKYCNYFKTEIDNKTVYKYEFNFDKLDNIALLSGCFSLFTTDKEITHAELLKTYRYKDICEKSFANLKNEIMKERLYVQSDNTCDGKIFVLFIALILRLSFSIMLKDMIKKTRSTLSHCLHNLGNIKCRKQGDKWILLNSINAEQRRIIEIMKIPMEYIENSIM